MSPSSSLLTQSYDRPGHFCFIGFFLSAPFSNERLRTLLPAPLANSKATICTLRRSNCLKVCLPLLRPLISPFCAPPFSRTTTQLIGRQRLVGNFDCKSGFRLTNRSLTTVALIFLSRLKFIVWPSRPSRRQSHSDFPYQPHQLVS
jgi:hypothetical protein